MTTANLSLHPAARQARWGAWALLSPLVAWLMFFVVAPTAVMVVYSFCERTDLGEVVFSFTLENWKRVLPTSAWHGIGAGVVASCLVVSLLAPFFWRRWRGALLTIAIAAGWMVTWKRISADSVEPGVLLNFMRAVHYAAASTGLSVLIGYPVAFFIAKARRTWRGPLLMLVMIPFWTSFLIRTYAWIILLKREGLINAWLQSWHVIAEPLDLLYTPTAVMVGLVYTYLPFMILPLYGSIERLDDSLIEAALDLGASPTRVFSRVVLPLTWPGIMAGVLLVFVPALGMFAVNDILGGKTDLVIGNIIDQQFNTARNPPYGATLGVLLTGLFVLLYFVASKRRTS